MYFLSMFAQLQSKLAFGSMEVKGASSLLHKRREIAIVLAKEQ